MTEGHLFVYGTLRPGLAPAPVARLLDGARSLGAARIPGRLYDLGAYPGARLEGEAGDEIQGEVFWVPDLAARLPALDRYEGFDPAAPERSLFVRTSCEARLADGSRIACAVYVVAEMPPAARRIASGLWRPAGAR
ncbi:MAG TPA: gamma-glutamylcyclotransferase family protein [Myxococcota bacterium]|nr:gamma-glutamylcyclotransferase family protein [Myxococcota bacterium]